jgi:DNA-binding transcriptional regulator YiaG
MSKVKPRRRPKSDIAHALIDWRRETSFSQSEAALKLKVSVRTLQEWEQGRATPRHLALDALREKIAR